MVPSDMFKYALIEHSESPESFYTLRNNYATSLAVNSISQWILGIGDRNLSNIMIDIKTGRIISIDFGHSFGSAISDLSIPELIPFRLTPQLINIMLPLGVSGILTKCMVHSLRCFRSSRNILMSCMKVFVKEPTIDWLESAKKYKNVDDLGINNDDSIEWNPIERIKIAEKKLSGSNPCVLTIAELQRNTILNEVDLNRYIILLKGNEQFNIRAQLSESNLSVEEQVNILIDLSTDYALLGITYYGFQPFI